MRGMKKVACWLFTIFAATAWSHNHGEKNLTFYVSSPSYPPFIYPISESDEFGGIIPELLNLVAQQEGITITYSLYNRFRAEEAMYKGQIDATVLAPEWATEPSQLVFSEPLLEVEDFFYQVNTDKSNQTIGEVIHNKHVCTRRGFAYPELEQMFNQSMADRVDTSSEVTQFKMLIRNRCQLAVANEFTAMWLIRQYQWQDQINQFPIAVSKKVGYTIAFTKKWLNFAAKFSEYVANAKQNGEIDKMVEKHLKVPMNHVKMENSPL